MLLLLLLFCLPESAGVELAVQQAEDHIYRPL